MPVLTRPETAAWAGALQASGKTVVFTNGVFDLLHPGHMRYLAEARAQGDAASFDKVYAQYKLAPEVTRRRMYYETMERVLSNNDKVIMEGNTTSYLPLPEARRRGPSVDVGPGTSGGQ